jgi:hypothetical protein
MKNDYSWIADKKREAMAAKLQRRGMPNMFPRTVAERYGVSYTGMGDDGRLDRSAPAGLDTSTNPPHIYHEGETRVATPEGAVYLNADVTSMADPGAMERMRAMEGTLPGFASGGGMLRGVPVSGMGGMPAAPQYRPADTPRVMGRGMLGMGAIGQQQQQQGNQGAAQTPAIRGWNGNPASMANSGLATVAQSAQPQPVQAPQSGAVNPLAGLRMGGNPQIPAQPQPVETLPGYASGGGQVQVIGDDGGVNQQYGGSGSNGANPTGSQPASSSMGNNGAGGFFKPINTAINAGRRGFGAATDFLKQRGAQAAMNSNNTAINPNLAKRADQNNGVVVNGAAPASEIGTGQTVTAPEAQKVSAPEIVAPPQQTYAGQTVTAPEAQKVSAPELRASGVEGRNVQTPPAGLSAETPTPYDPKGLQFQRGMEGQLRINDMRQEAASRQAYLQHQQAMNGTDANAAWAQSAMERAQAEEGINDFAKEYAIAQDNYNWSRGMDMLLSGDPNVAAAGAQLLSPYFTGTSAAGLFDGYVDGAKIQRTMGILSDLNMFKLDTGMSFDDFVNSSEYNNFAKALGWTRDDFERYWNNDNVNSTQGRLEEFTKTPEFLALPPDAQQFIRDEYMPNMILGNIMETFTWNTPDGQTGTGTLNEFIKANRAAGGKATITDISWNEKGKDGEDSETGTGKDSKKAMERADNILQGEMDYTFKKYAYDLSDEEYAHILKNTPEVNLSTAFRAGHAKRTCIPALDNAANDGSAVLYEGSLYYVANAIGVGATGSNKAGVEYTLYDPKSKTYVRITVQSKNGKLGEKPTVTTWGGVADESPEDIEGEP